LSPQVIIAHFTTLRQRRHPDFEIDILNRDRFVETLTIEQFLSLKRKSPR